MIALASPELQPLKKVLAGPSQPHRVQGKTPERVVQPSKNSTKYSASDAHNLLLIRTLIRQLLLPMWHRCHHSQMTTPQVLHPTLSNDVPASSSSSRSLRPNTIAAMGQTKVTPGAMEAAKKKFLKQTGSPTYKSPQVTPTRGGRLGDDTLETPTKSLMRYSDFRLLRHKDSTSSIQTDRDSMLSLSSAASIPSLASDHSDTATISSGPSSPPPSLSGEQEDLFGLSSLSLSSSLSERSIKPVSSNTRSPDLKRGTRPSKHLCAQPASRRKVSKMHSLLCSTVKHGGKYVSVPEPSSTGSSPRMYHADCFRCRICNGLFEGKEAGRAVFVRGVRGACHLKRGGFHFISGEQR